MPINARPILDAIAPLTAGGTDEEIEAALAAYAEVGRQLVDFADATPFLLALGEALQWRSPYEGRDERWRTGRGRQVALASSYAGKLHALAVVYRKQPPSDAERAAFRDSADAFLLACVQV